MNDAARKWAKTVAVTVLLFILVACRSTDEIKSEPPTIVATTPVVPARTVVTATTAPTQTATIASQPVSTSFPTIEPTSTSTPFEYIVVEGDTLIAIATRFETNVDEILILNPHIGPDILLIGERLLLAYYPTPTPPLEVPSSEATDILIDRISLYENSPGQLWLLGEVTNRGAWPLTDVQVEIVLKSEEGNLHTVRTWAVTSSVPVGESAPFGILVSTEEETFAVHATSVVSVHNSLSDNFSLADLALIDEEVTIENGVVKVVGAIRNDGDQLASTIQLVTTFYDDEKRVTGFHHLRIPVDLGLGDEYSFSFSTIPPGGRVTSHQFVVHGVYTFEK